MTADNRRHPPLSYASTSSSSPFATTSRTWKMASLESRLADRIQEDKSLPPLKVSLTKLTYNAVDRAQWRRHGKVTWAGAMKDAAIEEMFCDVQEHERLKVREGLQ